MQSLNLIPKSLALTFFLIGTLAWASPTLTVASPGNGANVGSPAYFDATARTSTCFSGISAIRIYSAPGVNAFTTDSFHLETFLTLKPGTYNTVIQAWDNCGGVTKVSRTITVSTKAGVTVFLPASSSTKTPFHFAVSAQNPACSKGISAIRIYPTPRVNAYTLNGNTLDAFINLLPGNYNNVVAQAWDNCGNVFKTYIAILDHGGPNGRYLYLADEELSNVALYLIKAGVLTIPGGASEPPTFSVPANANSVAVDPSGNFVYVGLTDGRVSVFEINRANGNLFSKQTVSAAGLGPAYVTVDRAGAFLFVTEQDSNLGASYRIDRNTGELAFISTFSTGSGPAAIATDFTGRFLYVSNFGSSDVSGYSLNTNTGTLAPIPGSPFASGTEPVPISAAATVVYTMYNGGFANGYSINQTNGSLTQVPGSPYDAPEGSNTPNSAVLDPLHHLLFYTGVGFTFGTDEIVSWVIQSDGSVLGGGSTMGVFGPGSIGLDPSYQYFYFCQINGYTGAPQVLSAKYNTSNGNGTLLGGPVARPNANGIDLAVSP